MKANPLESHEESTAYHEAGHAWVLYWHFIRMGWCDGVELTLEPTGDALGYAMARQMRAPDPVCWNYHAAFSAAGVVAEGLWAEREGLFSWADWQERNRRSFAEDLAELEAFGPEDDEYDGDLANWFRKGRTYELPVTLDVYWRGWKEAEGFVRDGWCTVEAIAQALLSKQSLCAPELLAICEETDG